MLRLQFAQWRLVDEYMIFVLSWHLRRTATTQTNLTESIANMILALLGRLLEYVTTSLSFTSINLLGTMPFVVLDE
jgi:hypothetical protein